MTELNYALTQASVYTFFSIVLSKIFYETLQWKKIACVFGIIFLYTFFLSSKLYGETIGGETIGGSAFSMQKKFDLNLYEDEPEFSWEEIVGDTEMKLSQKSREWMEKEIIRLNEEGHKYFHKAYELRPWIIDITLGKIVDNAFKAAVASGTHGTHVYKSVVAVLIITLSDALGGCFFKWLEMRELLEKAEYCYGQAEEYREMLRRDNYK